MSASVSQGMCPVGITPSASSNGITSTVDMNDLQRLPSELGDESQQTPSSSMLHCDKYGSGKSLDTLMSCETTSSHLWCNGHYLCDKTSSAF